jgi:hypothetical protein
MKKFWNYYLNIPKKGVMLTPIFINFFFGIPINTTFSRFCLQIIFNTNSCNMFIYFYVLFVGVSFILVLEIIDCSLMMILSLGKAELGM